MHKITRIACRFFCGEFDEEGNLLCELPVAAGKDTFNATIYHPFDENILAFVQKMNEDLNAKEGTEDLS